MAVSSVISREVARLGTRAERPPFPGELEHVMGFMPGSNARFCNFIFSSRSFCLAIVVLSSSTGE